MLTFAEEPLELSQDPISQVSDHEHSRFGRPHHEKKYRMEIILRGNGFPINTDEFRMPKVRDISPRSRRRRNGAFYGDGFEADEVKPIGKTTTIHRVSDFKFLFQIHAFQPR